MLVAARAPVVAHKLSGSRTMADGRELRGADKARGARGQAQEEARAGRAKKAAELERLKTVRGSCWLKVLTAQNARQ